MCRERGLMNNCDNLVAKAATHGSTGRPIMAADVADAVSVDDIGPSVAGLTRELLLELFLPATLWSR